MTLTQVSPEAPPSANLPRLPAHVLPPRSVRELLTAARADLAEAAATRLPGLRFATGHRAALRAAAAVVVARPVTASAGRRVPPVSLWILAVDTAPELSDWCASFAAGAMKRAAAEAGVPNAVTADDADDIQVRAAQFVDVVAVMLGFPLEAESPGDLADSDGLPGGLSVLVDMAMAAMTPAERVTFTDAWTRAAQAARGSDLSPVVGLYCEWRQHNLAATVAERAAKLVELVAAVAR